VNNVRVNKVSYNGGPGGTAAAPTPQERTAMAEHHVPATAMQRQHVQEAVRNPALGARANGGHPAIAATPRPAAFTAAGVVGAHGAAAMPAGARAPNGAQRNPGQQNAGQRAPGQGQQNNFVRTPGQPSGAARQGLPASSGRGPAAGPGPAGAGPANAAKAARPALQPKPQRPAPEAKKGEREK
jgi:hypothetical protein